MPTTPAEAVLIELGIEKPSDIDLEAIAWHCGAFVRYRPLDGCEARIIGAGEKAMIVVDDQRGPNRTRFSVGHELGHWRHHRGRSFICRPEDIGDHTPLDLFNPERVADAYAADLLLPNYMFARLANQQPKPTLEGIEALAREFGTSLTAAAIKMIDAGPTPSLLVCHGIGGRKWFRRHRDVPDRWFPREDLDADSYAPDVLNGKLARSHPAKMGADAWFDRSDASHYELIEQSIRVAGDVLTLLVIEDGDMLEETPVRRSG